MGFATAIAAALLASGAAILVSFTGIEAVRRFCAAELRADRDAVAPGALRALRRSVLGPVSRVVGPRLPSRWRTYAAAALRRAGHPGDLKPEEVLALVVVCAAAFLVAGALLAVQLDFGPGFVATAATLGASYPFLWLRDRARSRRRAIARALPYALDLLTLSVEAGLDFAAALGKVVVDGRRGPLAGELAITLKELRLGRIREEALRDLAARVEMPALSSFAHSLAQADRMGTPLAKVLRVLATQLRAERTQRAEKLAGEAPVKLLFPLIGCIFPTIFLMLFGPIVYQVFLGGSF